MSNVVYAYPVVGATAPTVTQAFFENMLVADVVFADADTTQLVTHNWNLTTTAQGFGPIASVFSTAVGTATAALQLGLALTNSVAVTLTKTAASAGTGVGWTHRVVLQRPHSIITGIANKGV